MVLGAGSARAEAVRVLVLPFSIHSDQDLGFLQKGITSMLSSRLTDLGKVTVLDQAEALAAMEGLSEPFTREAAVQAGQKGGAQYVAFGSLTVFGNSVSTDARFLEVATGTPLVAFSESGQNQGDAIAQVNRFAAEVNAKVFGRATAGVSRAAPAAAAAPAAPAPVDKNQMNPEKALMAGGSGMRIAASGADADVADATLWRSRRFGFQVNGLGLGDVDGDGRVETVFAGERQVEVFRFLDGQFVKVTSFELPPQFSILTLDVADINANKRAEIFINARAENYVPRAFVFEWDGTTFQQIYSDDFWYYRVNRDAAGRQVNLFGQRGAANAVVRGPVYRLAWVDGGYNVQGQIPTADGVSVFGLAYGDVTRDRTEDVVAFGRNDILYLFAAGGHEEWSSADPYGGSYNWMITTEEYTLGQRPSFQRNDPLPMSFFWLPQRVLLTDFDGDGNNEVLVVQSQDITRGLMQRDRMYRQGHFESLAWDNVGLSPVWRTRQFSGYISDYNLGDFNNDGQEEMVFAVVKKVGDPVSGEAKTYLVSWNPRRPDQQVRMDAPPQNVDVEQTANPDLLPRQIGN